MSQTTSNEEVSTSSGKTEKFILKPAFHQLLETVGASGKLFTLSQILSFMKNYIIAHNLYDKKNPRQIFCENDDLGKVLGVNKFTIDEVMKLLTRVLYRLPSTSMKDSADSSNNSQTDSIKRPSVVENVECKKQRLEDSCPMDIKPSSPIVICIPDKPDYDSTCETDLSIQVNQTLKTFHTIGLDRIHQSRKETGFTKNNHLKNFGFDILKRMHLGMNKLHFVKSKLRDSYGPSHETALAKDSTDDLWFLEEDDYDVEVEEDDGDFFSVEYEVGSQSSIDGSIVSDTDSDIEDVINAVLICKDDNDMEFWADDSSEDSEYSSDPELEEGDKWICNRCKSLNRPPMRYCQKCWDERIGWLPENRRHPPPRNGRKKRRTDRCRKTGGKKSSSKLEKREKFDMSEAKMEKEESFKSTDEANSDDFYTAGTSYSLDNNTAENETSTREIMLSKESSVEELEELPHDKVVFPSVPASAAVDRESNLCPLCMQKEKTAIIVHGRTGHQMCCYPCARHLESQNKPCPICRRTIQRVIRNFYV